MGSYARIPACVPNEFFVDDAQLPGNDVLRSPALIKLVRLYKKTKCNDNFDEYQFAQKLVIAEDYVY